MAMSLSPVEDAIASGSNLVNNNVNDDLRANSSNDNNNTDKSSSSSNSFNNSNTTTTTNEQAIVPNQSPQVNGSKRKSSRRANTAERRATHNAVERQRRETLNGRFLDLAALLPNLSQIRRPSKSSIVNSSIAHIQASRRHRLIASRELRTLKHESDALRRELNEWRDRAGLPRLEEPVRSEGFGMVLTGELEVISGVSIEEEDEDADEGLGLPMNVSVPSHQHHVPPQQVVGPYGSCGSYVDDVEEDVGMLGPIYGQQGAMHPHPLHHAPQMQQQQQQHHHHHQQHTLITHHHDLDDPRVAAMLLKNSNPFAHNIPTSSGYRSNGGYTNGPSSGNGWGPASQPVGYAPSHGHGHTHLFTPPATSHGVPTSGTASSSSTSGSPVGDVASNGNVGPSSGSPIPSGSSLSGGSPLSIITHPSPIPTGGGRRGRSGSLTGNASPFGGGGGSAVSACGSGGGQSPAYELHAASMAAMHEFGGVPRMGGQMGGVGVGLGVNGGYTSAHHHHHHQYGHAHGQQVQVGGVNGAMMMMMM